MSRSLPTRPCSRTSASSSARATASVSSPPTAPANRPFLKCLAGLMEPSAGDIVRSRGLRVALVEQDVPDSMLDVSLHDVLLDALPAEERERQQLAGRHGARRVRDAGRSARSADACAERRLAAAGADRTRLDHAAGPAASRRAHQPPRSRKAVQARGLDQQCGLHRAHRGGEPRPRLPRCLHHENAVPAAGGIRSPSRILIAARARCSTRTMQLRRRSAKRPCAR